MKRKITYGNAAILLAVVTLLVLFAGLGFHELESGDETRVAGIAAETFCEGNFLVPCLNGAPFMEYPPLYYWITAGAYSLLGINDFAAKFPSVLAAFGMVMLTFAFARKLKFSISQAFFSGLILLFSAQFFSESRTCRVDMLLAFFIELSTFSFYAMVETRERGRQFGYWILFFLGLAGGVYTKGLIGLVLPAAVIGSWLTASDILAHRVSWSRYAAAFSGGILALGTAGVWYALLWRFAGKDLFDTVFWTNNFGRFTGTQADHAESFFYYFIKIPTLFLPWLPILLVAMFATCHKIVLEKKTEILFLMLAIVIPFVLLCFASGKRVVYLMPLYAPCALLTGWYLRHLPKKIIRCFRSITRRKTGAAILLFTVAVLIGVDIGMAIHKSSKKSLRLLFEQCATLEKQGVRLFLIHPAERTRGAAYFYLHHGVPEMDTASGRPGDNECWIIRQKQKIADETGFADSHWLLTGDSL